LEDVRAERAHETQFQTRGRNKTLLVAPLFSIENSMKLSCLITSLPSNAKARVAASNSFGAGSPAI